MQTITEDPFCALDKRRKVRAEQIARNQLAMPAPLSLAALADEQQDLTRRVLGEASQLAMQPATYVGMAPRMLWVTAGPGVGKTTMMQSMIAMLRQSGRDLLCMTSTLAAADRLGASGNTGAPCHRDAPGPGPGPLGSRL